MDKYVFEGLGKNTVKELFPAMAEAKKFSGDSGTYAFCVVKGNDNTGVVLRMDQWKWVHLYYGKTDSYSDVKNIVNVLEAEPDDTMNAGL